MLHQNETIPLKKSFEFWRSPARAVTHADGAGTWRSAIMFLKNITVGNLSKVFLSKAV